jgi:beta-glucosidase
VEEWHNEVPAILQTFYNGMEGGNALARILFGEVNPSGKLPFTVPKLESDLPPFDSYAEQAEYGYYHGYTLFDKEKKQPRYPFGFGLSYTSFTISNLQPANDVYTEGQTISFTVDVTNTGQRAGAEVLQAYVSFNHSNIERHTKLLKAFAKVYLQKGESKTVQLAIPVNELKYYNENTQQWELEKGIYTIMVGNASNNLSLQLDTKII